MKRLLNTLYVTSDNAYLRREGESVRVEIPDREPFLAPIHLFDGIVQFGYLGASPGLIGLCAEHGVTMTFLSRSGRFLGRVEGPTRGNVNLRRKQYQIADREAVHSVIACRIVAVKVANSRTVLMRARRDNRSSVGPDLDRAIVSLAKIGDSALNESALNVVRGFEGDAAQVYFANFSRLLRRGDEFVFHGRNRRPPRDPVNAMLSFGYTLLGHECRSALESVGLDPAVGFLHRDRPGRQSLALDLSEEFRAYMVDRLVLSLINRGQVRPADFTVRENGAVDMSDETRKVFLEAWQSRKQEQVMHPWLSVRVPVGLLPFVQAQLLARYVRGELDEYPPFLWRQ